VKIRHAATLLCFASSLLNWPTAASAQKRPAFEVASVKPTPSDYTGRDWDSDIGRVTIRNFTVRDLIAYAYDLKSNARALGGPDWISKKRFDIVAKVDDSELAQLKQMNAGQQHHEWNLMMQSLLADRFGLKVSHDRRIVPVFALVVTRSGDKLAPASAGEANSGLSVHNTHLLAKAVAMATLADFLTRCEEAESRVVIDSTGLTGKYDFEMNWSSDQGNGIPPDAPYPGLLTALREQLGLELKPDKAPVDTVIVDSAEEPVPD
jgi:uncharacterized protein (TIGR03435 family)